MHLQMKAFVSIVLFPKRFRFTLLSVGEVLRFDVLLCFSSGNPVTWFWKTFGRFPAVRVMNGRLF